jgi:hypothetical protein
MKRCIAVLVVMMAVAPCCARADEAAKQAKAHELLMTMHMDHTVDSMMHSIAQQLFEVPDMNRLTPTQQKLTQDFQNRAMKIVSDRVSWKAVEPDYVKLYENTYSEQEIDGILAFYKSPAGQAMLAKAPQISAGVVQIVHSHMGDYQPKMQALQDEYMKQMTAAMPVNPAKKPTPH